MKFQRWWLATAIIVLLTIPGNRAWAEMLDANNIGKLAHDKTWQMTWAGGRSQFWDWKHDGSICARLSGWDRQEKCADTGRWRLQGDNLCWDLEWMGGAVGIRNACVTIERTEAERYEATRVGGLGITFFSFVVLDGSK